MSISSAGCKPTSVRFKELFTHALNLYGIPWQLCSYVYIHTLVGACVNSVNQALFLLPLLQYEANIIQGRALEM